MIKLLQNSQDDFDDEPMDFNEEDDDAKHQSSKPPSVRGEEDPFSGDATSSESPDIDEELKNLGLGNDEEDGPRPLGIDSNLEEE